MAFQYIETFGTAGSDQLSAGCGFVVLGLQGDDRITGVEGDNQLCLGGTGNNIFTAIPSDISMYVSVNGGHDIIVAPLIDLNDSNNFWGIVEGKSLFFLNALSPQGVIVINDYRTDSIDETFQFKSGTYRYSDLLALAKSGNPGTAFFGSVAWEGVFMLANGVTLADNKSAWQFYASKSVALESGGITVTPPAVDIHTFVSTSANETFTGIAGTDTAIFAGPRAQYQLTVSATSVTVRDQVAGRDGTDLLNGIERAKFSDVTIAFDLGGAGGQGYRIYKAAFNRTPDQDGVSFWINNLDKGMTLKTVAQAFVDSAEYKSIYGTNPTAETIVGSFYGNVLGRTPEKSGLDFWVGVYKGGMSTADLLINFSESAENQASTVATVGNGIMLSTSAFG